MKSIKIVALIGILSLLTLTAGGAGAQGPSPEGDTAGAVVMAAVSYQGRLTHPDTGAPLSGTYDLEFTFWSADAGGVQVGPATTRNGQIIANGLYSTNVNVDHNIVRGQELWLHIRVRETGGTWETLTPRVQVLPTMYAMTLRPGAKIQGEPPAADGAVLKVEMDGYYPNGKAVWGVSPATGYGVRGESPNGFGVYGYTEDGLAVWGVDGGSTDARGYGGYFNSANGVGVYGYSGATPTYKNMYTPGVYGKSSNGAGVYGVGMGSGWPARGGVFSGTIGMEAISHGSWSEDGYAGLFISHNYRGIFAVSHAGYYDGYFSGVAGIYSAGGYTLLRANRTLVVNGGDETLEPGDVVAISGVAKPLEDGGEPMLAVCKANGATDTAVVGVVAQAMRVQEVKRPHDPPGEKSVDVQSVEGSIPPGGYLTIVSHGLVPAVKVTALKAESLRVGDLLTPAAVPGKVQRAEAQYPSGTILGKVAGSYDPKTGTVPVFVTLQ